MCAHSRSERRIGRGGEVAAHPPACARAAAAQRRVPARAALGLLPWPPAGGGGGGGGGQGRRSAHAAHLCRCGMGQARLGAHSPPRSLPPSLHLAPCPGRGPHSPVGQARVCARLAAARPVNKLSRQRHTATKLPRGCTEHTCLRRHSPSRTSSQQSSSSGGHSGSPPTSCVSWSTTARFRVRWGGHSSSTSVVSAA